MLKGIDLMNSYSPNSPYKCQEHIVCNYEYKVVCNDDRFSMSDQIKVKMQFTTLLVKCLKKLSVVKKTT